MIAIGSFFLVSSFLLVFLLFCLVAVDASEFFQPDTSRATNDFAAAWLAHKKRLVLAADALTTVTNMAGASFAVVRPSTKTCARCETLMSYDYLDFSVEHLSSTTNQLALYSPLLVEEVIERMHKHINHLKKLFKERNSLPFGRKAQSSLDQTMAVIVYSSNPFSSDHLLALQKQARKLFLQLTFWTIRYYLKKIVIFVGSSEDYEEVFSLRLPDVTVQLVLDVPRNARNQTVLLPSMALLSLAQSMNSSGWVTSRSRSSFYGDDYDEAATLATPSIDWRQVSYVLFTEGDQLVHFRNIPQLFALIDRSEGYAALVPHRFQTLPLVQDFPGPLQREFHPNSSFNQPGARLLVQRHPLKLRGSCCDAGRLEVPIPCEDEQGRAGRVWWYQCVRRGLKDLGGWMKIGEHGATFPLATEHRRFCVYHAQTTSCPTHRDRADGKLRPLPTVRNLTELRPGRAV